MTAIWRKTAFSLLLLQGISSMAGSGGSAVEPADNAKLLAAGKTAAANTPVRAVRDKPAQIAAGDKAAKPGANGVALDTSGEKRVGKGSYYGKGFIGKQMADGTTMNPHAHAAASKTLPLGTIAKVTNLNNGKSVVVKITDRGPYVHDRIVDVTPVVADRLDLRHHGVVPVEVTPVVVALPGGRAKAGAAARDFQAVKEAAQFESTASGG